MKAFARWLLSPSSANGTAWHPGRGRALALNSAIAMAGAVATMGFAYLFHFAMVRMLPTADYGELGVLMAIFAILTVPLPNIQSIISRPVTLLAQEGRTENIAFFVRKYLKKFSLFALAALLSFAAISAAFPSLLPLAAIAAAAVFSYLVAVEAAYFQGTENVLAASLSQVMIAGGRVAIGAALVLLGLGLLGAAFSVAIGAALAFALLLRPLLSLGPGKAYHASLRSQLGSAALASIFLGLFMYADLFAVRAFFGPEAAGIYNSASLTSRVLYLLAASLVLVLMPQSSKAGKNNARQLGLVGLSLLFLLPVLAIFLAFPSQIISIFYTPEFAPAAGPFALLSIAMFAFSAFFLLLNVMWSRGDERTPLFLSFGAVLVQVALVLYLVPSGGMGSAALATLIASIAAFAAALLLLVLKD